MNARMDERFFSLNFLNGHKVLQASQM